MPTTECRPWSAGNASRLHRGAGWGIVPGEMATYVIGDLHGCHATLQALWADLDFDEARDHLWLTGDLVNRGPDSLECLRWARDRHRRLGERFAAVLGNHDLHLLARAEGIAGEKKGDTLDEILAAPDAPELLAWLARRPFLHRRGDLLLVHAGLLPDWTADRAEERARELESAFWGNRFHELLERKPPAPEAEGRALRELRRSLGAFTLLRTCTADGVPCRFSGFPEDAPEGCLPWFAVPGRRSRDVTVIFGHWAALGLHLGDGVLGLDSACVWGRRLTALRFEDENLEARRILQRDCLDSPLPAFQKS